MSGWQFTRAGFVTFGNPNHYDGSGLLLRELRARCRDADMEQHQKAVVAELEQEFKAEYGKTLTEALAIRHNMGDQISDLLSDMAPQGYVFEIRKNPSGDSNWGYFSTKPQRWTHMFECSLLFEIESGEESGKDLTNEQVKAKVMEELARIGDDEWLDYCSLGKAHKVRD